MFEHQTPQILQFPQARVSELISRLIFCIKNPLHDVQEAGFRAILSLAIYIRINSASPSIRDLLEHLLTESLACLFIDGVDSETVSIACAAVHGLSVILSVLPVYEPADYRRNTRVYCRHFCKDMRVINTRDLEERWKSLPTLHGRNLRVWEWKWIQREMYGIW